MDVNEVKQQIHQVLLEKLHGTRFSNEKSAATCRDIVEAVKARMIAIDGKNYKYIVEAQLFEKCGGGFRAFGKCYWDAERDKHIEQTYQNVRAKSLW